MSHVVVCISWADKGEPQEKYYGPFEVREGWPLLAEIEEFTKRWIAANGQPSKVTLHLVEPPETVGT